jgi:hypothetical protein
MTVMKWLVGKSPNIHAFLLNKKQISTNYISKYGLLYKRKALVFTNNNEHNIPEVNILCRKATNLFVIPAKAGIQKQEKQAWIPACAGMTESKTHVFYRAK